MRRINQSISLILCILMLAFTLGNKGCSPEQRQTFKHQALVKIDSLANGIKLAQGINEDLYNHHKISPQAAIANTEKLQRANRLGRELGERVKAIDANASTLPSDLTSTLDEIVSLLRAVSPGLVNDDLTSFLKAISDVVEIAIELKGLIK
jgi:hypothetical protein